MKNNEIRAVFDADTITVYQAYRKETFNSEYGQSSLKAAAVPQYKAGENLLNTTKDAPKMVDPLQPGDPFELPPKWHKLLEQNYIKGSAKILN